MKTLELLGKARPYAAEIGVAGLWAVAAITAAIAAAEAVSPGVAVGFASPGSIIVFAAVFLGLSLLEPLPEKPSWRRGAAYAALTVLAAASAFWAAWYHFERSAEARTWLAAAAAAVVLGVFRLSGRGRRR